MSLSIEKISPDVLGLQEVDYYLERSGSENQVESIATFMKADYWAFAPSVIGSPDEDWTPVGDEHASIVSNKDAKSASGYGIGLVSKIPVVSWHRVELRRAPVGIMMALPVDGKVKRVYVRDHPRSAIAAVLENGWMIVNTHLSFVPVFNLLQLAKIKRWIKGLPIKDKTRVIIMGDLNVPWSIMVKGFNWNSLARQKSFPSWNPRIQIDYLLSQKVASEDVRHSSSVHEGISDHLPLTVDIEF